MPTNTEIASEAGTYWILLWASSFGKERRGVNSGDSLSEIPSLGHCQMGAHRSQRASIVQKFRI